MQKCKEQLQEAQKEGEEKDSIIEDKTREDPIHEFKEVLTELVTRAHKNELLHTLDVVISAKYINICRLSLITFII